MSVLNSLNASIVTNWGGDVVEDAHGSVAMGTQITLCIFGGIRNRKNEKEKLTEGMGDPSS